MPYPYFFHSSRPTRPTKKYALLVGTTQNACFETLKKLLTVYPILRAFNPSLSVEIHTDTSGVGVGAVLIQGPLSGEAIVSYASKTLNGAQRNYGATQLELSAVVHENENFNAT